MSHQPAQHPTQWVQTRVHSRTSGGVGRTRFAGPAPREAVISGLGGVQASASYGSCPIMAPEVRGRVSGPHSEECWGNGGPRRSNRPEGAGIESSVLGAQGQVCRERAAQQPSWRAWHALCLERCTVCGRGRKDVLGEGPQGREQQREAAWLVWRARDRWT